MARINAKQLGFGAGCPNTSLGQGFESDSWGDKRPSRLEGSVRLVGKKACPELRACRAVEESDVVRRFIGDVGQVPYLPDYRAGAESNADERMVDHGSAHGGA